MKVEEIQKLCDEASIGPWYQYVDPEKKKFLVKSDSKEREIGIIPNIRDAKFIAVSRNLMPKMCIIMKTVEGLLTCDNHNMWPYFLAELEVAYHNVVKE